MKTARSARGTGTRGTRKMSGAPKPSAGASSLGRPGASTTRNGGATSQREESREGGLKVMTDNTERAAQVPGDALIGEDESPAPAHEPTPRLAGGRPAHPLFALGIK